LSLDGRFRYKVRVHKVTGVSPFSRMFECNSAPSVSEIKAVFVPSARSTIYWVEASDPDGDDLAFDWTLAPSRRPCGVFTAGHDMLALDPTVVDAIKGFTSTTPTSLHGQGAMAIWFHPQELCPHDATAEHEGKISVVVSDGRTESSKEYDRGSRTNQSR
jgi:hypothetical protein